MTTLNNLPHKKDERRTLRNNLTSVEAKLWSVIKNSQLADRKFCRQHRVSEFVLDFYCPEQKLAVELDGVGTLHGIGQFARCRTHRFFDFSGHSGKSDLRIN